MQPPSDAGIIKVLLDISREMVETRALDPLLDHAVKLCMEHFDAEYGYLVLLEAGNMLDFRIRRDRHGNTIPEPDQQISHTIFNQVIRDRQPVLTASAIEDPQFSAASSVVDMQLRSVLCVPLISRERSLGALYLENRSADHVFTKAYIEPLRYFASQAAAIIENAMLNEALEERIAERTAELRAANTMLQEEIEERQRIEQELVKVAVERERSDILTRFIQDASHQFRTPLSVIRVAVDLLQLKHNLPADNQQLTQIKEQVKTIVRLIDNMVLMVKLDSQPDLTQTIAQINEIVLSLEDKWHKHAEQADLTLHVEVTSDLPAVRGDEDLLADAMESLISNAMLYNKPGGNVWVRTSLQDDQVVFTVRDDGDGIPQEDYDHIFQRFFRSDEAGTTRGFGLGLSIAQLIVELHGGQITFESEVDKGSIFRIMLPV